MFGQQAAGRFAGRGDGFGAAANPNPNNDKPCQPAPQDSVSQLKFAPPSAHDATGSKFLAASSWDGQVICYEHDGAGNTKLAKNAGHPTTSPALCCDWHTDGDKIFAGFGDNSAQCLDLNTGALTQMAQHDAPIKNIIWCKDYQMLITGSWDKTVKFWSPGDPTPKLSLDLPDRCYTMDMAGKYLVCGCAERKIRIFDVSTQSVVKDELSPLKYQTRCVSVFPEGDGYAIGSIEGKVGVQYFQETAQNKNFSFRCHRGEGAQQHDVYAVNCIAFNEKEKTFATCGSDGAYNFWDKRNKQRLKAFKKMPEPITCGTFSADARIFAYASCYDWHKGIDGYNPQASKSIHLHGVLPAEIQPKNRR